MTFSTCTSLHCHLEPPMNWFLPSMNNPSIVSHAPWGCAVLPPALEKIPSMLVSYDWEAHHIRLMAIAAIAEGTSNGMLNILNHIVQWVSVNFYASSKLLLFRPSHVSHWGRGQLCTDLEVCSFTDFSIIHTDLLLSRSCKDVIIISPL